jgi:nitrogen fixation protein NifT
MAKVMLRESEGKLFFYVAKKDMEEVVVSVEFDSKEKWGGRMVLSNDQVWYVEPGPKALPSEVVAKRLTQE